MQWRSENLSAADSSSSVLVRTIGIRMGVCLAPSTRETVVRIILIIRGWMDGASGSVPFMKATFTAESQSITQPNHLD